MRTDVKIGVALGAVVLIVAVSYFGSKKEKNIALREVDHDVQSQNAMVIDNMFAESPFPDRVLAEPSAETPPFDLEQLGAPIELGDAEGLEGSAPAEPADAYDFDDSGFEGGVDVEPLLPNELQEHPTGTDPEAAPDPEPVYAAQPPAGLVQAQENAEPGIQAHIIQRGDTFSSLAEEYYGSSRHARFLADGNPQADPYHLRIGSTIKIRPLARKKAQVSSSERKPLGSSQYRVAPDDNLYRIAERLLGSPARWEEIYRLNRRLIGPDPAKLQIGQVLQIPSAGAKKPG